MRTTGIIIACLLCAPAQADPPDEATKRAALLWAYEANGNSMTSWGSWDYQHKQRLDFLPREVPVVKPQAEPAPQRKNPN